ncbi:RAC-gamma serine/threonine-protein kinase [Tritrichomonas musculus]|uniref:RAC-gamma serine/threonine-protein kinase n=1 Tax=Tritrichomonas musculus TaxID=1915356 RepID=A0ABR2L161_9EUKA
MSKEPVKTGYLCKLGGKIKTKKQRFFVLTEIESNSKAQLSYYKKEKDFQDDPSNPIGTIIIQDATCVTKADKIKKMPAFYIMDHEKKRNFEILAKSDKEVDEWIEVIKNTCSNLLNEKIKIVDQDVVVVNHEFCKANTDTTIELVKVKGKLYIQKTVLKSRFPSKEEIEETNHIFQSLCIKSNPFVANVVSVSEHDDRIIIIEEYASKGCLFGYLWKENRFSERRMQIYAAELILAINFLHENNIKYLSLDPCSILLNEKGHIKLTIPINIVLRNLNSSNFQMNPYFPIDIITEQTIDESIDWYLLGVLLYEMVCGYPPFWDEDPEILKRKLLNAPLEFPRHVKKETKSFIRRLMERNNQKRLGYGPKGVEAIKKDAFFADYSWESSDNPSRLEFVPEDSKVIVSIKI